MTHQIDFFDERQQAAVSKEIFSDINHGIVKKFWAFHLENPRVYELFKDYTMQMKRSGRQRFGAKAVFERIRWHVNIETSDPSFKLSNNYTSCYARLLIMDDPSLKNFFQLKRGTN